MQKFNKNKLIAAALIALAGGGIGATLIGIPKSAELFKPATGRFNTIMDVLADSSTGELFTWIKDETGEERFVKLDKISESEVRKDNQLKQQLRNRIKFLEANQSTNNSSDVRSGEIFEITQKLDDLEFNTRIKYRAKERQMLYRIQVSIKPEGKKLNTCLSKAEEKTLNSIFNNKEINNKLSLRFQDRDLFWLQDSNVPLTASKGANNGRTTIIDSLKRPNCETHDSIVFHGRFKDFTLPDYDWVDDGKMMFAGVQYANSKIIKTSNENN